MHENILLTEKKNVYCLVLEETEIFGKKWAKISGLLLPKLASSLLVILQVRRSHMFWTGEVGGWGSLSGRKKTS